jgi:hypothetical protein
MSTCCCRATLRVKGRAVDGGYWRRTNSTKGSLGSPSSINCMLFLIIRWPVVVVFVVVGSQPFSFYERPPSGAKSKRIFLSADTPRSFDPIRLVAVLGQFYCSRSVVRLVPQVKRSTPKKSVSCVSVRVVLVMSEPIRVVFIGVRPLLFLLCVRDSRSCANFQVVPVSGASRTSLAWIQC